MEAGGAGAEALDPGGRAPGLAVVPDDADVDALAVLFQREYLPLVRLATCLSLVVPDQGDVPGRWAYSVDDGSFWLGLDVSPSTGNANVTVEQVDEVYAPGQPWTEQTSLVPAPTDADGWVAWVEATGLATVSDRAAVVVDGSPATRFTVQVADTLPESYLGCAPGERCLGLHPIDTVGSGFQAGFPEGSTVELTVLEVDGQPILASALGAPDTADRWLPLMRSVVDSVELG